MCLRDINLEPISVGYCSMSDAEQKKEKKKPKKEKKKKEKRRINVGKVSNFVNFYLIH